MEQSTSRGVISLVTMGYMRVIGEGELEDILTWVDQIPLSREKKNLARDFSDGVTLAEIVKHYFPKMVELRQFTPASNTKAKEQNWFHLNRSVLSKVGLELDAEVVHALAHCRPWVVENVLIALREKIDELTNPMSPSRTILTNYRAGDQKMPPTRSDMFHHSYDKQQRETIEKQEETIELLTAKVKKLEEIIRQRDKKIDDLSKRLTRAGYDPNEPPPALHGRKTTSYVTNRITNTRR